MKAISSPRPSVQNSGISGSSALNKTTEFEQKVAKIAKDQTISTTSRPSVQNSETRGSSAPSRATGFEQKTAKIAKDQNISTTSRSSRPSVQNHPTKVCEGCNHP